MKRGFHVFDSIPLTPFQPLLWAVLPSAASTGTYKEAFEIVILCHCGFCSWYNRFSQSKETFKVYHSVAVNSNPIESKGCLSHAAISIEVSVSAIQSKLH
jgi:hypothetical protein